MDAALLSQADEAAERAGLNRTQIIERALRHWLTQSTLGGGTLPAGFTPRFQELLQSMEKTGGFLTVLMLDPARRAWVFSGSVIQSDASEALNSGFLTLRVRDEDSVGMGIEVPIPIASIIGWTPSQRTAQFRQRVSILWRAIDGNDVIARGGSIP